MGAQSNRPLSTAPRSLEHLPTLPALLERERFGPTAEQMALRRRPILSAGPAICSFSDLQKRLVAADSGGRFGRARRQAHLVAARGPFAVMGFELPALCLCAYNHAGPGSGDVFRVDSGVAEAW